MGVNVDLDYLTVQKMRMGDEKAFEEFVVKYYPGILKYCQMHVKDYGYAEDITQETFMRFFQTLKEYRHYGKLANYLYVIARNLCRDFHRKRKEIPYQELPETAGSVPEASEERIVLGDAFGCLPEELKETAVLFFGLECKQKDIARILGISLSLVKYRIRRARELLTAYLEKEGL